MRGSPGKIEEYSKSAMGLAALLYNFDVGMWNVKPEHIQWLSDNLKPFARSSTLKTTVIGFASRSGKAEGNQSLSVIRAHTTQQVIWRLGGPPLGKNPYPAKMAFGESAAAFTGDPDSYENERWRSVYVCVSEQPKLPDPPKVISKPPKLMRTKAVFIADTTVGGALSGGDGGRAAQNSQRLANELWGVPTDDTFSLVPADATLSRITAKRVNSSVGLSDVGLPGMLDTSMASVEIDFIYTVGWNSRPTFNNKVLDTDELEDWITNPSKKWFKDHLISL